MWVDSEGSARGCDTSCVWVLLPRDHGPKRGVGLVPRCCGAVVRAGHCLRLAPGPLGKSRLDLAHARAGSGEGSPSCPWAPPKRCLCTRVSLLQTGPWGCGCVRAPCASAAPALGALPVLSQGSPRGAGDRGRRELQGLQLGAVGAAAACGCASTFGTLWSYMTPRLPIMACFSNKMKGFIFFLCH